MFQMYGKFWGKYPISLLFGLFFIMTTVYVAWFQRRVASSRTPGRQSLGFGATHQRVAGGIAASATNGTFRPQKRDEHFSREYIFQPLIFRGHVSFQGSKERRRTNAVSYTKAISSCVRDVDETWSYLFIRLDVGVTASPVASSVACRCWISRVRRLQQWKIGAGVKWWMVWISGKYCGLVVNKFGQNVLCLLL